MAAFYHIARTCDDGPEEPESGKVVRVAGVSRALCRLDSEDLMREHCGVVTATVEKIADEVRSLRETELDDFLSWLVDYELAHPERWDEELERDSQPGGRLDTMLKRVRGDIAAKRTKPLDEVVNNS